MNMIDTITVEPGTDNKEVELRSLKYCILLFGLFSLLAFSTVSNWFIGFLILYICLWACVDFVFALFILLGIAIAQGKVGLLFHSGANVIIDDIYLVELFFPVFSISFLLNSRRYFLGNKVWHKNVKESIILVFAFVIWAVICVSFSEWKVRGLTQSVHTLIFFLYLAMFSTFSTKELHRVLAILLFWGVIFFIMALLCISGIPFELESVELTRALRLKLEFFGGGKRASLLSPPAVTAVTLGLCAWSAYALGILRKKQRFLFLFLGFLISIGIFYTRTRSEMVGFLFAGFGLVGILGWRKGYTIRGLSLWFLYVLVVWVLASGLDLSGALKRIKTATDIGERASLGIRLGLWKQGLIDIAQSYGMGKGTGGFFGYNDQWPHAHNVYFSVLFDLGIIGFFLWVLVYLNLWRLVIMSLKKLSYSTKEWLMIIFFAAFFIELSLTSLLQHEYTHFMWWLFPGILLASINNGLKICELPIVPSESYIIN